MKRIVAFALLMLAMLSVPGLMYGQSAQDTPVPADTVTAANEINLGEILIEGVIEKPNVSILPTRVETDFDRIEYINRAFKVELQMLPARAKLRPAAFERLQEVEERIQSILKRK